MKKKILIFCIFFIKNSYSMQTQVLLQEIMKEARLRYAIDKKDYKTIRKLICQGVNIHAPSQSSNLSIMNYAQDIGHDKCVRILKKADKKGRTPRYATKK